MSKGFISTQQTVWCGKCCRWHQDNFHRGFGQELRKIGWRKTNKDGWMCPDCSKKKEEAK